MSSEAVRAFRDEATRPKPPRSSAPQSTQHADHHTSTQKILPIDRAELNQVFRRRRHPSLPLSATPLRASTFAPPSPAAQFVGPPCFDGHVGVDSIEQGDPAWPGWTLNGCRRPQGMRTWTLVSTHLSSPMRGRFLVCPGTSCYSEFAVGKRAAAIIHTPLKRSCAPSPAFSREPE